MSLRESGGSWSFHPMKSTNYGNGLRNIHQTFIYIVAYMRSGLFRFVVTFLEGYKGGNSEQGGTGIGKKDRGSNFFFQPILLD